MSTMLTFTEADEALLVAEMCRDSLWDFVKEFWDVVIDEPLVENWHMPFICKELEKVAQSVIDRKPKAYDLLINIAPGTTKSTIVSEYFPVWCWLHAPWIQTICGSYEHSLALDLSVKSRSIVLSEKFKKTFPDIRLRVDQNTKSFWQNEDGGWRMAVATGGGTGRHGHLIIIDDPVDPGGADSEAEIKAANDWLTQVIPQRKVDKLRTVTIMIMQRLSQGDPSGMWIRRIKKGAKIKHICIPAAIEKGVKILPPELRENYVDGVMDPYRLGKDVLKEHRANGEYVFSGQFLQMPIPPGGGMFKVERFKIETLPKYPNEKGWRLVRYWDKAATAEGGCYTVGVLMGKCPGGRYYVLDVVRGQWDSFDRERVIKQTAKLDGTRVRIYVEEEGGAGGKESAEATIRNLAGYSVRGDRPGENKFRRADPYAAQVNGSNVLLRKADWNDDYIDELRFFGINNKKNKDQVDASSGAFAKLSKRRIRIGAF